MACRAVCSGVRVWSGAWAGNFSGVSFCVRCVCSSFLSRVPCAAICPAAAPFVRVWSSWMPLALGPVLQEEGDVYDSRDCSEHHLKWRTRLTSAESKPPRMSPYRQLHGVQMTGTISRDELVSTETVVLESTSLRERPELCRGRGYAQT